MGSLMFFYMYNDIALTENKLTLYKMHIIHWILRVLLSMGYHSNINHDIIASGNLM